MEGAASAAQPPVSEKIETCCRFKLAATVGNYNATTLASQFISSAGSVVPGVSMVYSSTTGKFTYSATGDFVVTAGANQPFLGLSKGTHTSTTRILVSDHVVNLGGPMELRILTDIPKYSSNTSSGNSDLLISVYPNVSFGNVVNYTNQNFAHIRLNTARIGLQSFQLVNEYNEELDLNGLDWNLTLLLTKD